MPKVAIFSPLKLSCRSLSILLSSFDEVTVEFEAIDEGDLLQSLSRNEVEILVIDVQKPIKTPSDIIANIRKLHPNIKVLIISQTNMNQKQILSWGANGFITRDSEPDHLLRGINRMHTDEFFLDENLSEVIFTIISRQSYKRKPVGPRLIFSKRELEIIKLTCKQFHVDDIARKLYITRRTVEGHKSRILEKTSCKNFIGVVLFALKSGALSLEDL